MGKDEVGEASNAPITYNESEILIKAILEDFSLTKAAAIKKELHGYDDKKANTIGLEIQDFIDYETKHNLMGKDMFTYLYHINILIRKFCVDATMSPVLNLRGVLPLMNDKYVSFLNIHENNHWDRVSTYASYLGLDYIKQRVKKFEVLVTVKSPEDIDHQGSGTLISKNIILTCKHVTDVDKFRNHHVYIDKKCYEIKAIKESDNKDIALIYIDNCPLDPRSDIIFGTGKELQEIITFGYPPVPLIPDPVLICQKGEINAITEDYFHNPCLIISSIVRPGNSGGAIISETGHFVGMVTDSKERHSLEDQIMINKELGIEDQLTEIVNKVNRLPQIVPFYCGLIAKDIYEEIRKMDPTIEVTTVYQ